MRSHDGLRMCGLHGRRSIAIGNNTVRLRLAAPEHPLEVDLTAVRSGVVEYVLAFPAGRKLEDRVLDVLRVVELAASKETLPPREVVLHAPEGDPEPDEFLIAARLLAGELDHEAPEQS